ncbi:MAG TPA: MFS transporter, partial [Burkholderiales bacterium]|nr:MFS transporter [Burkholderiales bacterium]
AYQTASFTSMSSDTLQNVAQALFVLPFFLFSATAGQLADKYEKSMLITVTVAIELACMALGTVGLITHNLALLFVSLFLGGVQSALFGPVKYAILPQHLREEELVGGNGLVEMGTSVAILAGMMVGGWMVAQPGWGVAGVGFLAMSLSAAGIALSRAIPKAPAADAGLKINWNPFTETWRNLQASRGNRTVFLSILGISWFWFYGSMLVTQFPNLAKNILMGGETIVTLLLVVFSIGIGLGSLLCERLSGHKVEVGLVPFGSIGLTLFGLDLGWTTASHVPFNASGIAMAAMGVAEFLKDARHWRLLADLFGIGLFGGFYIVPLYAFIQTRSEASHRSRIIAANNILNAVFMVVAAGLAIALFAAGLRIPQLIVVTALMNAAVALYIYLLVPEFLMRFMVWILIRSVYRLRQTGLERIPEDGPAVLVCNHVSYVDALVISAACHRPIRWVMYYKIFHIPFLRFFFRTAKAIPIAGSKEDPRMLEQAYEAIARELAAGELVGLFPEGGLTSDGEVAEFRGGVARILERTPVPVIPMALSGLWRSIFARNRSADRLFPRVRLAVGEPVPAAQATPEALRSRVLDLRGAWR